MESDLEKKDRFAVSSFIGITAIFAIMTLFFIFTEKPVENKKTLVQNKSTNMWIMGTEKCQATEKP